MGEELLIIDLNKYVTAPDAIKILSKNAGKPVNRTYLRDLEEWGFLHPLKVGKRTFFYPIEEIENYKVGQRGTTYKGKGRRCGFN